MLHFARIAKDSKEYQGHGWGCSYLENNEWNTYRSIVPIWEDDLSRFTKTTVLVVHARSAFRDEGIHVENNMPFCDEEFQFVFNGELRGVRVREHGRIGAEKLFNFVRRLNEDPGEGLAIMTRVLPPRAEYIRAMNCIIASKERAHLVCWYGEDPEYFQLWESPGETYIVCSKPYGNRDWRPIANKTVKECA